MGTWTISPNVLASIDNNGKATFSAHTENIVYTIKYNDEESELTKTFTVYPCAETCDCEEMDMCQEYGFNTRTDSVEAPARSFPIAASFSSAATLTPSVVSGNFITGFTTSSMGSNHVQYVAQLTPNTSTSPKTAVIKYASDKGCTFTQTLIQEGAVETQYTFTVNSNVDGASVTWSNGSSGTISNGKHQITSTSSTPLTVTLSKEGYSFTNNGASCSANGSVTINGSVETNCEVYNFDTIVGANIGSIEYRRQIARSAYSAGTLSWSSPSSGVTDYRVRYTEDDDEYVYDCIILQNNEGAPRDITFNFTNNSGCTFTAVTTQKNFDGYKLKINFQAAKEAGDTSCLEAVSGTVTNPSFYITFADNTSGTTTLNGSYTYSNKSTDSTTLTFNSRPSATYITSFPIDNMIMTCDDSQQKTVSLNGGTVDSRNYYYTKVGAPVCTTCGDEDSNYITFIPKGIEYVGDALNELNINFDNSMTHTSTTTIMLNLRVTNSSNSSITVNGAIFYLADGTACELTYRTGTTISANHSTYIGAYPATCTTSQAEANLRATDSIILKLEGKTVTSSQLTITSGPTILHDGGTWGITYSP